MLRMSRRHQGNPVSDEGGRSRDDLVGPNSGRSAGVLLYIRASYRHAELFSAHFREHGDAFADLLMRWTGKTQPQPAAGIDLVGRPFRSRIDGDAGGKGCLVQL